MSFTAVKHIFTSCVTLVGIMGPAAKPTPKSPPFKRRGLHAVNRVGSLLPLLLALCLAAPARARDAGQATTAALAAKAHQEGRINLNTKILILGQSVVAPEDLPAAYRSDVPTRDGTMILVEIRRTWDQLSAATKSELENYGFVQGILARPTAEFFINTDHFRIFFSKTGPDAVEPTDLNGNTIPDYIDTVAIVAEEVFLAEHTNMGYVQPPPDAGAGGDDKYDIYVFDLGAGLYGWVAPETYVGDNVNSGGVTENNTYYSYMAVQNDYSGFIGSFLQNIQVTMAHEYFHAVQFGYDGWERSWVFEATAAWIEDEVYDDVNDNYQYLPSWFADPDIALDFDNTDDIAIGAEFEGHWYGSWIFFRYLSERNGLSIIRQVWESSVDYDSYYGDYSFNALNDALVSFATTFRAEFSAFTVANVVLEHGPSLYPEEYRYEEADGYSTAGAAIRIEGALSFAGDLIEYSSAINGNDRLMRHSADYFDLSGSTGNYRVVFETVDPLTDFGVQLVKLPYYNGELDYVNADTLTLVDGSAEAMIIEPATGGGQRTGPISHRDELRHLRRFQ